MTTEELYNKILDGIGFKSEPHPLHKAILLESCANALNSNFDKEADLLNAVRIGFVTSSQLLRGMALGLLKNADIINLEYGGQKFTLDKDSSVLKEF